MTTRQKIELRLSEVRSRLNEIAGLEGDGRTEEIRTEQTTLTTEFGELETRFQAATLADPDDRSHRRRGRARATPDDRRRQPGRDLQRGD